MGMHFTIPAPRALIEEQIEALITLLDALDGDPDLEEDNEDACYAYDDAAGPHPNDGYGDGKPGDPGDAERDDDAEEDDPSGGAIDDQPHDQDHLLAPRYGIDQSKGPINEVAAVTAWEAERRSYGVVGNVGPCSRIWRR